VEYFEVLFVEHIQCRNALRVFTVRYNYTLEDDLLTLKVYVHFVHSRLVDSPAIAISQSISRLAMMTTLRTTGTAREVTGNIGNTESPARFLRRQQSAHLALVVSSILGYLYP
jgi:hypothetical protein